MGGIGFLGAGVIWKARGEVTGMTTAATIWVIAAIGIAVGDRERVGAIVATLFVLLTLAVLRNLEDHLDDRPHSRTIRVEVRRHGEGGAERERAPVRRVMEVLSGAGKDPIFLESQEERSGLTVVFWSYSPRSRIKSLLRARTMIPTMMTNPNWLHRTRCSMVNALPRTASTARKTRWPPSRMGMGRRLRMARFTENRAMKRRKTEIPSLAASPDACPMVTMLPRFRGET